MALKVPFFHLGKTELCPVTYSLGSPLRAKGQLEKY